MTDYPRPELTQEEYNALIALVRQVYERPKRDQIKLLSLLLIENASLTKEVNDHRRARGFDPLPSYQPRI